MKLEFSRQIFKKKKHLNIKFHENPFSERRVVPCGRTGGARGEQTDGQTDMTKLTVDFHHFANGPKKGPSSSLTGTFVNHVPYHKAPGGKGVVVNG